MFFCPVHQEEAPKVVVLYNCRLVGEWYMSGLYIEILYSSASAQSWTWTTVVDGHKFSPVRRLSRRLLWS